MVSRSQQYSCLTYRQIGLHAAAGLSFSTVSLGVNATAVSLTSTSASFSVDQQVGYLQYGRSIACRLVIIPVFIITAAVPNTKIAANSILVQCGCAVLRVRQCKRH